HSLDLQLGAARHWTLTARQSLALELTSSWDRSSIPVLGGHEEASAGALRFGHATDFRLGGAERRSDLRWENSAQVQATHADSPFTRSNSTDATVTTALALRTDWTKLRL